MPSGKQDAITLSFSEKNKDVYRLLKNYKNQLGQAFIQNDYLCQCVRFYEKNKDKSLNTLDEDKVKKLIDERFNELKREFVDREVTLHSEGGIKYFNNRALESNLDFDQSFLQDD